MLAGRSLLLLATAASALGATPVRAQRPGPGSVTVNEFKGGANVSWRGIRDATVSYRVLRGTDPRKPGQDITKPLAYDVTSLNDMQVAAGSAVYYTVVAVYSDGSEGASVPVPFTAPGGAAPMPTATPPRGAMTGTPLTMAPPMALRATAPVTAMGPYTWVTVSWPPVITQVPGPVTYVVRRSSVDPATLPPNAPLGYVTGGAVLGSDGRMSVQDRNGDLHAPSWYMVVASSQAQGSVSFPWVRRDPPAHRGVDTVSGSYWRVVTQRGSSTMISWGGCAWASTVPGAVMYGARLRVGAGNWVDINMRPPGSAYYATQSRLMWLDTNNGLQALVPAFETGAAPQVQMWPVYSIGTPITGPYLTDTLHLQPVVFKFQQVAVPLIRPNCS